MLSACFDVGYVLSDVGYISDDERSASTVQRYTSDVSHLMYLIYPTSNA